MAHWKKVLLLVVILLSGYQPVKPDSKNIILMESDIPYRNQTWFSCGEGNELQQDQIRENWDDDLYIHSVAYGASGWIVSMAKGFGFTAQSYSYDRAWPKDWISQKENAGYAITSAANGNGKWLIVMSKGSGITSQVWTSGTISEVKSKITEWWDKDYYITGATHYSNGKWLIISSKGTPYSTQSWASRSNYDDITSWIKQKWNDGYHLQLLEYGNGTYFAVACKYTDGRDHSQNYKVLSSSPKEYIKEKWDKNMHIAYIGGGHSESASSSGSRRSGTGRLPNEGESIYMQASGGGLSYASIRCFRSQEGELRYNVYPDQMATEGIYVYKHDYNSNGNYVLRRYHLKLTGSMFNMRWDGGPDGTEVLVSQSTGSITLPNGTVYDKPITVDQANAISAKQQQIMSGTYSGGYYSGGGYTGGGGTTSGSSGGSAYTTCRICSGSGVCTSCHGSKGSWHDTGYYTGSGSKSWIDCPSCHGTGRCFNCHGSGRQ